MLWPFWFLRDHMNEARSWIDQLAADSGALDPQARAELAWTATVTALDLGDDRAAWAARERLGPLVAGIQDPYLRALSELAMAWSMPIRGDFDGALRTAAANLEPLRDQDEPFWTAVAVSTTGAMETVAGRYDDALRHLSEARELAERFDYGWLAARDRVYLGALAVRQGRLAEARELLDEGLNMTLASHNVQNLTVCLMAFARLAFAEGDPGQAALLAGAADGMRRRDGRRIWATLRRGEDELAAQIGGALGTDRFDRLFASGSELSQREAVAALRATAEPA
jgi:ATP/maltotriose-dependent transcriptional regulator MalT